MSTKSFNTCTCRDCAIISKLVTHLPGTLIILFQATSWLQVSACMWPYVSVQGMLGGSRVGMGAR